MRNLLIMRHAKSDWENRNISDFDRPLNNRGINDAPMMGSQIIESGKKSIDLIISSPANRTQSTAKYVSESVSYNKDIQLERNFYFGYIDEIIFALEQISDEHKTVLLVGHNPTVETLIYNFINKKIEIIMPTAAVASIFFDTHSWKDISNNAGKLEWLIKPKDFR